MNKTLLIIGCIIALLLVSKPKDSELESKVEAEVYERIMPDTNLLIVSNMAQSLASTVEVKNYYLFNVAYLKEKSVGYGFLFMTFVK
jgi:hypothetical protein